MSTQETNDWWFILPTRPRNRDVLGHFILHLDQIHDITNLNPAGSAYKSQAENIAGPFSKQMRLDGSGPDGYLVPFKETVPDYLDFNTLDLTFLYPTETYAKQCIDYGFVDPANQNISPPVFMITGVIVARYVYEFESFFQDPSAQDEDFIWAVRLAKIWPARPWEPRVEIDWRTPLKPTRNNLDLMRDRLHPSQRRAFPQGSAMMDLKETLFAQGFPEAKVMATGWGGDLLFVSLEPESKNRKRARVESSSDEETL